MATAARTSNLTQLPPSVAHLLEAAVDELNLFARELRGLGQFGELFRAMPGHVDVELVQFLLCNTTNCSSSYRVYNRGARTLYSAVDGGSE
jgi:hypothetical protein